MRWAGKGGRWYELVSTILEVAEVLGADAAEMIREVAVARRQPRPKAT
jgi:hypothetical protein